MTTRPHTAPTQPAAARNGCQAIPVPADANETPLAHCPYRARVSSFCWQHAEELRMLEEREHTAAREAGRLKPIIDEMVAEGTDAYMRVRDIRKDERIVRLYSQSLKEQINAAVPLETQFFSEGERCAARPLPRRISDICGSHAGW